MQEGAAWVADLAVREYSELSLETRMEVLVTLVSAALEGPSLRASLEERQDRAQTIRRTMAEENRVRSCLLRIMAAAGLAATLRD